MDQPVLIDTSQYPDVDAAEEDVRLWQALYAKGIGRGWSASNLVYCLVGIKLSKQRLCRMLEDEMRWQIARQAQVKMLEEELAAVNDFLFDHDDIKLLERNAHPIDIRTLERAYVTGS